MGKRKKKTNRLRGMQGLTLCISTTMVLVLLGLVVFSVLSAHVLSNYVKENLTVTVMLNDTIAAADARQYSEALSRRVYTHHVSYVSKEDALKEQSEAMGSDPSEFLGVNPFVATLELQLKPDYANRDSLQWIARQLKKEKEVTDVAYQEDLMDKVNANLQRVNMVLLILACLLTFISYSLVSNTVRLGVYSRRFLIHTMKLVGASWGFIRWPFMRRSLVTGVAAAVLACIALGGAFYALCAYEPRMTSIATWEVLAVTGVSVFLFGIIITSLCTYISVNHFLRMTAGELYKI